MTDMPQDGREQTLRDLLSATLVFVRRALADSRWDGLRAALPESPAAARETLPQPLPVLHWLDDMERHAAPETRGLCTTLARAAPHLPWGLTYSAADLGAAFLERYGWMELVGQRGPYTSNKIACGFLLLGPEIEYPRHRHEAEEVYIVLAGTADWLKADGAFAPQTPGTLIHHPPWCWHAMRTGDRALLALYLWSGGNLTQKSEIGARS